MALVLRRVIISISAAVVVAILAAIALAILDLYLSGHGYGEIRKEPVSWAEAGVHLSIADIILLSLSLAAGAFAWIASGRARPRP